MSIEQKLKTALGELNFALVVVGQQLEDSQAQLVDSQARVVASHELLAACIRSDQVPADEVQKIMADEVFAAWYKRRYPEVK